MRNSKGSESNEWQMGINENGFAIGRSEKIETKRGRGATNSNFFNGIGTYVFFKNI